MRSKSVPKEVQAQCAWGLARGLEHARPDVSVDAHGYVMKPDDNLLPRVRLADFEADLRAGAGAELDGKFLAAHSSSALAINCFAPFRHRGCSFDIGRHHGLRLVGFEQRFSTGLARAQPPHLDVLATAPSGRLVAIESKCTEYLSPKVAKFSERYKTDITDERASGPWFAEMLRLMAAGGVGYRFLDASQLIKHAFGLANQRHSEMVTLVYLYWEPLDAGLSPLFAEHRAEIAAFTERVAGGNPSLESMSYAELWETWVASGSANLLAHVQHLRSRYEVPAWAWEGVSWVDGRITNALILND
jgi:hypothetical protein